MPPLVTARSTPSYPGGSGGAAAGAGAVARKVDALGLLCLGGQADEKWVTKLPQGDDVAAVFRRDDVGETCWGDRRRRAEVVALAEGGRLRAESRLEEEGLLVDTVCTTVKEGADEASLSEVSKKFSNQPSVHACVGAGVAVGQCLGHLCSKDTIQEKDLVGALIVGGVAFAQSAASSCGKHLAGAVGAGIAGAAVMGAASMVKHASNPDAFERNVDIVIDSSSSALAVHAGAALRTAVTRTHVVLFACSTIGADAARTLRDWWDGRIGPDKACEQLKQAGILTVASYGSGCLATKLIGGPAGIFLGAVTSAAMGVAAANDADPLISRDRRESLQHAYSLLGEQTPPVRPINIVGLWRYGAAPPGSSLRPHPKEFKCLYQITRNCIGRLIYAEFHPDLRTIRFRGHIVDQDDETWEHCEKMPDATMMAVLSETARLWMRLDDAGRLRTLYRCGSRSISNLAFRGLHEASPVDDVNRAFRAQARAWHPDRNGGSRESTEATQRLNLAMEIIRISQGA